MSNAPPTAPTGRPAESWRRIARLGATVCCLATLMPTYGEIGSQWNMGMQNFLYSSWQSHYQMAPDPKEVFIPVMLVILTFFQATLLAPIFFLFATGPWMTRVSRQVTVSKIVLFALLALFTIVPPRLLWGSLPNPNNFGSFPDQTFENRTIWSIGFVVMMCYLFLIGLSILIWRDKRGSASELLALAAVPFAFSVLRWGCMLSISVYRGMAEIFAVTGVMYLAGALMLGVGFVQALRVPQRETTSATPTKAS